MGHRRASRRAEQRPRVRKDSSADGSIGPTRNLVLRFSIVFLSLVFAFALLTSTAAADSLLHSPLSRLLTFLAASALSLGGHASSSGTYLEFNGFSVSIVEACDGILPTYIYLAAVLALPSRWREKLWGILIGIPAIFFINLTRIVTLMLFGAKWPGAFERVHIYVWQALVIALSMAVWVFWAERFVGRDAAVGA